VTGAERRIAIEPLDAVAFRPFGDVIAIAGTPSFAFNAGLADRFHDLARLEAAGEGARLGISLARARPYALPLALGMVERHPLGSQAFVPLEAAPLLVVVAPDEGGVPGRPRAFLAGPGVGVNYLRGVWHGVLTPLERDTAFLIVDRIGPGANLEEHRFPAAWTVVV
jgi:ureidoglycolate lyase